MNITCEICDTEENIRRAPIMTGVPFSAPDSEQRYVCKDCVIAWHEGAGSTKESILRARGLVAQEQSK